MLLSQYGYPLPRHAPADAWRDRPPNRATAGYSWSLLEDAADPTVIVPGALILAGEEGDPVDQSLSAVSWNSKRSTTTRWSGSRSFPDTSRTTPFSSSATTSTCNEEQLLSERSGLRRAGGGPIDEFYVFQ